MTEDTCVPLVSCGVTPAQCPLWNCESPWCVLYAGFTQITGFTMSELDGCLVLVVEDEPIIALHIAESFKEAGARVVIARTLEDAMARSEHPELTAAVIDHALHDGLTTSDVCARLKERNIPFVVYSGFSKLEGACASGELVHKPANPQVLLATLVGLMKEQQRPRLN